MGCQEVKGEAGTGVARDDGSRRKKETSRHQASWKWGSNEAQQVGAGDP